MNDVQYFATCALVIPILLVVVALEIASVPRTVRRVQVMAAVAVGAAVVGELMALRTLGFAVSAQKTLLLVIVGVELAVLLWLSMLRIAHTVD